MRRCSCSEDGSGWTAVDWDPASAYWDEAVLDASVAARDATASELAADDPRGAFVPKHYRQRQN